MNYSPMQEATRERAAALFSAMSHPVRLRIVELLIARERSVGEIAKLIGIGQSGASQHLAILARAGVLVAEARGTSHFYRVRGPRIEQLLTLIGEFCRAHGLYGAADEADENG